MVGVLNAVRVGVGVAAPPLEVLAAHQACVDVVVRQGYAAKLGEEGGMERERDGERGEGGGRRGRKGG